MPLPVVLYTFNFYTVYGFDIPGQPLDSPSFTAVESNNQKYSLPVRIIKGSLGQLPVVVFDAEVLPGGTAGEVKNGPILFCEIADYSILFLTLISCSRGQRNWRRLLHR